MGKWEHRAEGDHEVLNWGVHYGPLTSEKPND